MRRELGAPEGVPAGAQRTLYGGGNVAGEWGNEAGSHPEVVESVQAGVGTMEVPLAGLVRFVSIGKRTTKNGQPFWVVKDHTGQESKIWNTFEDNGERVQGDQLAAVVEEVIASGDAVAVKTRETEWGLGLLAVHRRVGGVPSEDTPDPSVEPDEFEREELAQEEQLDDEDLPF